MHAHQVGDQVDHQQAASAALVAGGGAAPGEGVRTIVDATAAATLDTVYCGVGRNDRTLEIGIADLIAAADARVVPLVQES